MRNNTSWLQHIPKHWEVKETKYLFSEIGSGTTPDSGSDAYYPDNATNYFLQTGDLNDGKVIDTNKKISDLAVSTFGMKQYPKGSLVIAMYGATIGKLGILEIDTTVNQACCVLQKSRLIDTTFAFYVFAASKPYILLESKGGTQPNINQDTIRNWLLPLPPLSEQEKIARYLDTKVGEIDQKVSLIEKKIERYQLLKKSIINKVITKGLHPEAPLKDSQISWLGQIPAHWEVKRLKDLHSGANVGESIDKEYWSSNSFDKIFYTAGETFIYSTYENFPKYKLVGKDDLLLSRNGTPYVYLPKLNALYTDHIIRIRLKTELCDKRYVRYCLQRSIEFEKVDVVMLATWSMSIWNEQKISLPPLSEQQEITSYLDQKCADCDAIIANCTAQIEKYKTLKRALINEVVTGQRAIE